MSETLYWQRPKAMRREYHLHRGEAVVASLAFPSVWRYHATGSHGDKSYRFSFEGVFRQRVRVLTSELGEQKAYARMRWALKGRAEIELPDGRTYRLTSKGILRRVWSLTEGLDGKGRELLAQTEVRGVLHESGVMEMKDLRPGDPDPLFLALIAWYLVVVVHQQEGAAAAGAT